MKRNTNMKLIAGILALFIAAWAIFFVLGSEQRLGHPSQRVHRTRRAESHSDKHSSHAVRCCSDLCLPLCDAMEIPR